MVPKVQLTGSLPLSSACKLTGKKGPEPIYPSRCRGQITSEVKEKLEKVVPFARNLVLEAGKIIEEHRKGKIDFEIKPDGSKVTKVDKEVQKFYLDQITKEFPNDRITAEEILEGKYSLINERNPLSSFRWVIDPVDGTRALTDPNSNYFGTTIALMYNNDFIYAAFYAPEYELDGIKGLLFEASELSNDVLLNDKKISINPDESNFYQRTVAIGYTPKNTLNITDFKTFENIPSFTLIACLISAGHNESPVAFANRDVLVWDLPGIYFVEKAGGISVDRNREHILPVKKETMTDRGPIIPGDYFVGYPKAVGKLLES